MFAAFASQTFSRAFIVVDYLTNSESFAKACENKTKPQLHCKGKCQMMKKIQEEEKKDQNNPERRLENKAEIVLSSKSFYPGILALSFEQQLNFILTAPGKTIKMPRTILRPPIV